MPTNKVVLHFRVFCDAADELALTASVAAWLADAVTVFGTIGIVPATGSPTTFDNNRLHFAESVGQSWSTQDQAVARRRAAYRKTGSVNDIFIYVVDIVEGYQGIATQETADLLLDQAACGWDLAHELGHVLGLDDTSDWKAIMYQSPCSVATNKPGFSQYEDSVVKESDSVKAS